MELFTSMGFGYVTISLSILGVALLILAAGYSLFKVCVYYGLSFDKEGAPSFSWNNPLLKLLNPLWLVEYDKFKYTPRYSEVFETWVVDGVQDGRYHRKFESHKEAQAGIKEHLNGESNVIGKRTTEDCGLLCKILVASVTLDTLYICVQLFPMPVIIGTSIVTLLFGIRKLSGYVWKNMSNIGEHEERITTLEKGDVNE